MLPTKQIALFGIQLSVAPLFIYFLPPHPSTMKGPLSPLNPSCHWAKMEKNVIHHFYYRIKIRWATVHGGSLPW